MSTESVTRKKPGPTKKQVTDIRRCLKEGWDPIRTLMSVIAPRQQDTAYSRASPTARPWTSISLRPVSHLAIQQEVNGWPESEVSSVFTAELSFLNALESS